MNQANNLRRDTSAETRERNRLTESKSSRNIRFCRFWLKAVEADVLKYFASSVLAAAKVRKLYKQGGKQYWEFYVPAVNGFAKAHRIEVKADNAYEARAEAWTQILEKEGLEDKGMGAAIG